MSEFPQSRAPPVHPMNASFFFLPIKNLQEKRILNFGKPYYNYHACAQLEAHHSHATLAAPGPAREIEGFVWDVRKNSEGVYLERQGELVSIRNTSISHKSRQLSQVVQSMGLSRFVVGLVKHVQDQGRM